MKKKLLALAIGAVAALPVAAFATGPTLYGQIDLSVENVDVDADTSGANFDGETTSADNSWVLRDNASRLGVRGEAETSVSGLAGIYQAEFGLGADDGSDGSVTDSAGDTSSSVLGQRNIFVGLKSDDLGTLMMGNFDSPLKTAQGKVDQFNDSTLDIDHYVAGENRLQDVVQYSSPKIADAITVTVAANTDEASGAGNGVSASVVFEQESLYLAVAFDNGIENQGSSDDLTDIWPGDESDIVRVVAGYNADGLEVGVLFQEAEYKPDTDWNETSIVVSGALKAGDWKFKAQYGQTEGDTSDETFSSLAVGADYALGKSTTVYALAGIDEAKDADDGRSVAGVGLRQKF